MDSLADNEIHLLCYQDYKDDINQSVIKCHQCSKRSTSTFYAIGIKPHFPYICTIKTKIVKVIMEVSKFVLLSIIYI